MSEQPSIHMGHGQMVDIVGKTSEKWEIIFSEAGVTDYQAPPPNEIEADAIDVSGKIHPLAIAAGASGSTVVASGQVDGAYRVRVRVWHGTHFHTCEASCLARLRSKPLWGRTADPLRLSTGACKWRSSLSTPPLGNSSF
ncbi:hypothetical protein [Rhizobium sp. P44RR-XXIV]|uniref:hypothetical protein n=1 Tax=Rhizobium sp. P44RR-XXIV TaxID=1921145 RepID=UPI001FEE8B18|nr:hypothetical protein [Rhizobium sp. P44RR-XXIV]